jgi:tetratricopeptide (TPR) repeat protein
VVGAVLSSGGDDEPQRADRREQQPAGAGKAKKDKKEPSGEQQQPAQPPPAPAPEEPEPEPQEQPASSGAALNEEGFALMQQGDYAGAVPILREAVASWPENSRDINYAYALFNLGKSLNRSGSPEEAIPYLEKRLGWPDQQETVQAELDLAKRSAGEG